MGKVGMVGRHVHLSGESAYCFGSGLYAELGYQYAELCQSIDSVPLRLEALVAAGPDGYTVVFCFRAQVFYTRALVAPVSGIASGQPRVEGLFDSAGREV